MPTEKATSSSPLTARTNNLKLRRSTSCSPFEKSGASETQGGRFFPARKNVVPRPLGPAGKERPAPTF